MYGYKFNTKQEAETALTAINNAANLPKGDNITSSWTSYNYAELNEPPFYYIISDDLSKRVLGEDEELNIINQTTE